MSTIRGHIIQPQDNSVYSDELVKEVKKFQLAEGLKPDGIIGPRTIILFNNMLEKGTPLLNKNVQLTMKNE